MTSKAEKYAPPPPATVPISSLLSVTMVICDDDDGPLHHPDGIVAGYSGGNAIYLSWEDLDLAPPDDPDDPEEFLGDASEHHELVRIYGH